MTKEKLKKKEPEEKIEKKSDKILIYSLIILFVLLHLSLLLDFCKNLKY